VHPFPGDNSPKKRYVNSESLIGYTLVIVSFYLNYYYLFIYDNTEQQTDSSSLVSTLQYLYNIVSHVMVILLSVASTALFYHFKIFFLFRFYDGGRGAGFNFYYDGWRVFGLDWHSITVRQDLKTGKPLRPEQQFTINRPHIDIPSWNLHHWPWAQTQSHQELQEIMAAKKKLRELKLQAKEARKARRRARVEARNAASAPSSPSPDMGDTLDTNHNESASTPASPASFTNPTEQTAEGDDNDTLFPFNEDEVEAMS